MATAAILCPEAAGGLLGRALMNAGSRRVGHAAFHTRLVPESREIHYLHRKKASAGALARRFALGEYGGRAACRAAEGWGLAYAEENHRPSLAAAQRAACLRGRS